MGNDRIKILCTSFTYSVHEVAELLPEAQAAFSVWSPGAQVHPVVPDRAVGSSENTSSRACSSKNAYFLMYKSRQLNILRKMRFL